MTTSRGLQWQILGVASLAAAGVSGWLLGTGTEIGLREISSHLLFAFGLGAALYIAIDRLLRQGEERARMAVASRAVGLPPELVAANLGAEAGPRPLAASDSGTGSDSRAAEQVRRLEALGRTTGAVLHDVNNMLTAIAGHAELALRRIAPGGAERVELEGIAEAAERCARLTRQLLPHQRDQVVLPRPLELNTVVLDMRRMLSRLLGDGIELVVVPGASRSLLLADLGQIERLVLNLAVNARDAMPSGGVLRILTENVERLPDPEHSDPGGLGVALVVQDTGQGMDAATRHRLFEPGFSTRPAGAGTGFGLSTVQEVARQSSGTIECQTAPGRGTTFRVVFPLAHGSPASASGTQAAGAPPRGDEAVLLLEQDPGVRELCHRFLSEAGYRVLEASDSAEALELTGGNSVRLLLADATLSGGEGPALVERLLLLCPEARVLYMSGYGDARRLPPGVADGTADFLGKPFSRDELLRAVRRSIDRPAERCSPQQRSRVLVIDDDAEVRRVLHSLLEAAGFEAMTAPDGEQGLEQLAWQPADVVLCDIFMPNKEGIETCAELRRRFPELRVIAMSGAAGASGYLRAAEKLGAVASLHKPFTGQELVAVVQGALAVRAR